MGKPFVNAMERVTGTKEALPVLVIFFQTVNVTDGEIHLFSTAKLCPRLQRPSHGTITPSNCMIGDTFSGQRCVLHCDPGFKPVDRRTAFCEPPKNWLPNPNLSCVQALSKLEMIKPHIKCPQDSIILLPEGKKTIHVKLEQPNTNVDWWK